MRLKTVLLCLLAITAACILTTESAYAFCCGNNGGICADCTQGTPCCATQSCNIFCCNCDGSCRTGPCSACRGTEADARANTKARFEAIDTDDDGAISWKETKAWADVAMKVGTSELRRKFRALDKNNNERIEPQEFDKDLP